MRTPFIASAIILGLLASACSSGPAPGQPDGSAPGAVPGSDPDTLRELSALTEPSSTTEANDQAAMLNGLVSEAPQPIDNTCASARAAVERTLEPVDIILVLDNSGSMEDELEAVERNINENFAQVLTQSDVDYRVILISRHRKEPREDSEEASTSICVKQPLSSLSDCPSDEPSLSERFFHYSIKIESEDSLDRVLETLKEGDDGFSFSEAGWIEWLRLGARKVFLEVTDDNAQMSANDFVQQLMEAAPEHFGNDSSRPGFVFHSIVGIQESAPATSPYPPEAPIEEGTCSGNDNDVENAGETYQELSRLTGGLRFPLCQFTAYDSVFRTIAEDVVVLSNNVCEFEVPEPPAGRSLDLDRVAVAYATGEASPVRIGQAASAADCVSEAFFVDDDRIRLCEETCDAVRDLPDARVEVLFECESTILQPL